MTEFYEICLKETSDEIERKSESLGWDITNCSFDTVFLEADEWGELKRKIKQKRNKADVLVYKGGNEKLNRKAAEDTRVDVLLHPEKGRKDSGVDHVIAEKASNNKVAIGLDFRQLMTDSKTKSHILKHWRRNLMLCEKYDAPYIITSGAEEKLDLRAPRDLKSIIESLGYNGSKAASNYPQKIIERSKKAKDSGTVRPGVEKVGDRS